MDQYTPNDDRSITPLSTNTNVFDDEFEVSTPDERTEAMVADGFRPQPMTQDSNDSVRDLEHPSEGDRIFPKHSVEIPPEQQPPVRSSISKGHDPRNSFGMMNDGSRHRSMGSDAQSAYAAQTLMHRNSVGSTASFVTRSSTPLGGPSHPYTMYPQGTAAGLSRTSSNVTSSTIRNAQRAFSNQRPAHAYAMYPQNVPEDEESHIPQQSIPVGFPGHNTGYHRRIGPDGEEQDIIGPDGHTEQLPPYSRYPEETSKSLVTVSPVMTSTPVDAPPQPHSVPSPVEPPLPLENSSPGSIPVPMTDRSPTAANNRGSIQSAANSATSLSQSSDPAREKRWGKRSLANRSKQRVCGRIPLWLIILLAGLVIVFAIILGAAIGSIFTKAKKAEEKFSSGSHVTTETVTATLYDASIIPTPSNLPPLPTGPFAVPLENGDRNPRCLSNGTQQPAWLCDIAGPPLEIDITPNPSKSGGYSSASLSPNVNFTGGVRYGMQPPNIDVRTMDVVVDHDQPDWGPAFHFQGQYNKLVVLDANAFSSGNSKKARGQQGQPPLFLRDDPVVTEDRPWYCWWNQTFIEVYMYATVDTSDDSVLSSSGTITSSSASSPTGSPIIQRDASPTMASPTPTVSNSPWEQEDEQLPFFPFVIKVEERRIPGSTDPYCQQMQMLDNGEIKPAQEEGQLIFISLTEEDPSPDDFIAADNGGSRRRVKSRGDPPNGCHCQWITS